MVNDLSGRTDKVAGDNTMPGDFPTQAHGQDGGDQRANGAGGIARRAVLRRGAKLVYVVPAVFAAMTAKSALALS
jgi:hypothetical protein